MPPIMQDGVARPLSGPQAQSARRSRNRHMAGPASPFRSGNLGDYQLLAAALGSRFSFRSDLRLATEADLLGQFGAGCRIVRCNHRIIGIETPARTVFGRWGLTRLAQTVRPNAGGGRQAMAALEAAAVRSGEGGPSISPCKGLMRLQPRMSINRAWSRPCAQAPMTFSPMTRVVLACLRLRQGHPCRPRDCSSSRRVRL